MTTEPDCVYAGCDDNAKVIRKVVSSGRELAYCRDHDPLRQESEYKWAFTER